MRTHRSARPIRTCASSAGSDRSWRRWSAAPRTTRHFAQNSRPSRCPSQKRSCRSARPPRDAGRASAGVSRATPPPFAPPRGSSLATAIFRCPSSLSSATAIASPRPRATATGSTTRCTTHILVVLPRAGHMIQLTRPDSVMETIHQGWSLAHERAEAGR